MVTNAYCGCRQHLDDENDCQHRELPMPSQRISDSLLDAASSFAYAAFRKQMVVWCYSIIDHCKFNREIVPITISYLDRFIATPAGSSARINREIYQLAAMACLYTAIKIHGHICIHPKAFSGLSSNVFSSDELQAMETKILFALNWRMNPPTSLAFVRKFLHMIPSWTLDIKWREAVYNIAKYQTELAVTEFECIAIRPSTIAFCAVMNSLARLNVDDNALKGSSKIISRAIGIQITDNTFQEVRKHLDRVMNEQPTKSVSTSSKDTANKPKSAEKPQSDEAQAIASSSSPRSVVGHFTGQV